MQAKGASAAQATSQVPSAQQAVHASQVQGNRAVETVIKAEKTAMNKATTKGLDPVKQKAEAQKSQKMLSGFMDSIEKGAAHLDKIMSSDMSKISNGELLKLQAGMYKYTQELELTGKVVEKATTGLKDTLKTQV